jgi:hypothetical protein
VFFEELISRLAVSAHWKDRSKWLAEQLLVRQNARTELPTLSSGAPSILPDTAADSAGNTRAHLASYLTTFVGRRRDLDLVLDSMHFTSNQHVNTSNAMSQRTNVPMSQLPPPATTTRNP